MKAARTLKRVALVGMMAAALTIGSAFTQPVATVSASILPGSVVGAPDIGYPCPGGCQFQGRPAPAGDIGYPTCTTCRVQDDPDDTIIASEPGITVAMLLPPSGDIGYRTAHSGMDLAWLE